MVTGTKKAAKNLLHDYFRVYDPGSSKRRIPWWHAVQWCLS